MDGRTINHIPYHYLRFQVYYLAYYQFKCTHFVQVCVLYITEICTDIQYCIATQ